MRSHWKTATRIAPLLALTGGILLAAAATIAGGGEKAAAQGELEYRVFGILVGCDSCGQAVPTATATSTSTSTPGTATPTGTATATSSSTPATTTPTGTATATGTAVPTEATATQTPTATTPTATATPTGTPDPTCTGATAEIIGLNKSSNPETITITGTGLMEGWYILSTDGIERFDFPDGFVLNGTVEIRSGSLATANPPAALLWTTDEVWTDNANDDAYLFNCEDFYRDDFDDGLENEESN